MEKSILKNKITIYYYPLDNAYSTSIGLYINSGSSSEPKDKNGMTHLLEHLHFRHLEDMTQKDLYVKMDKIGANLRASTHKDCMRFYLKVRPLYFAEAIKFFQKIITMYDWTEEDFEIEKQVVYNELESKEAFVYTEQILDSLVWEDHPLGMPIIGTKDSIDNLKLHDIIEYKQQCFSAENIAVVITGIITENIKQIVKQTFENISLTYSASDKNNKCPIAQNGFTVKLLPYNWEYVDIKMAFKTVKKPNMYELMILNSILGGGTGSKLQSILREKLALSSDVYSYIESYNEGDNIRISLTTHKNNIYKCITEIVSVINNLKVNINDEDMQTNLPYFTENLWYRLEDSELLNNEIGWDIFNKHTLWDIEKKISEYKKVTKNKLLTLTKEIFTLNNTVVLIAGDVEQISPKIIANILSELI